MTPAASPLFEEFEFLPEDCSEPCIFIELADGQLGGLVYFDANADGTFQLASADMPFQNLQVRAFTNTFTPVLVAITLTDSDGVYRFNRSALFAAAVNPAEHDIFIRINNPFGTIASSLGVSGNVYFDNVFVVDPSVSNAARTSIVFGETDPEIIALSAGFQDSAAACDPELGPQTGSDQLILRINNLVCNSCTIGRTCGLLCDTIPGAQFRTTLMQYTLDNSNAAQSHPAASVTAELAPLGGEVRCLEPYEVSADPELRLLQIRRPNMNPPFNREAAASYGFGTIPAGETHAFVIQWDICFEPGSPLTINTTLEIFRNHCVKRVRDWRMCVDPSIDPSDCYQELVDELDPCFTCLPTSPTPPTPPTPMPSPTLIAPTMFWTVIGILFGTFFCLGCLCLIFWLIRRRRRRADAPAASEFGRADVRLKSRRKVIKV